MEATTDEIIERLLRLKLTRFAYGYCLGLRDHNPTEQQQAILSKIVNQYSQNGEIAGTHMTDHNPQQSGKNETTQSPNGGNGESPFEIFKELFEKTRSELTDDNLFLSEADIEKAAVEAALLGLRESGYDLEAVSADATRMLAVVNAPPRAKATGAHVDVAPASVAKRAGVEKSGSSVDIDACRQALPLPELMGRLGYGNRAKTRARCLWHEDKTPSFGVFEKNGRWRFKCHWCDVSGDEIDFLQKVDGITKREAIIRYAELAGISPQGPNRTQDPKDAKDAKDFEDTQDTNDTKDANTPNTPQSTPQSWPQNRGKETVILELVKLGKKYSKSSFNDRRAFMLASNARTLESRYGELSLELKKVAYDAATEKIKPEKRYALLKTYLAAFKKVQNPMADNLIIAALSKVADMGLRELPEIPGLPLACEADRRILALHREMHALIGGKEYFLGRRNIQEAMRGKMNRYEAINACEMLEMYGLIQILDRGTPGKGQGEGAARYRYIGSENTEEEIYAN